MKMLSAVLKSTTALLCKPHSVNLRAGLSSLIPTNPVLPEQSVTSSNIIRNSKWTLTDAEDTSFLYLAMPGKSPWMDKTAYESHETGLAFSHEEIMMESMNFRRVLHMIGIKQGDVVSIVLPNMPHFPIAFYALMQGGIIANLMSPLLPPDRLASMISRTGTKVVITTAEFGDCFKKIQNSPEGATLLHILGAGSGADRVHDLEYSTSHTLNILMGNEIRTDPSVILWSSGTTGFPKPVVHTQASMIAQFRQIIHPSVNVYREGEDVMIAMCPLHHAYANAFQLRLSLSIGAKVITMEKFVPKVFASAIKKHRPTVLNLVPSLIDFCVQEDSIERKDFEQVHTVTSGGLPISLDLMERFFKKFGRHIFFQENYGMSESGCTHIVPISHHNTKVGSAGQLVANTCGKILDKQGNALPNGRKGELWVKGPQAMKGYFTGGNSDDTHDELFDKEGWLRTGDVGYYDEDGFLFLTDRVKDLIKVKGFQVSPSQLQGILNAHPKISDSAVIGVPDNQNGEKPKAFIVRSDESLTEAEINAYLEDKIAIYERLTGGVEFVKEIPKGAIGKILRNELK